MKKYLIIGNGIAGTTAAEQIRKLDNGGEIRILTRERLPLYSRIRLPDYLCGKIDEKNLIIKDHEWHTKHGIELLTGVDIKRIDYDKKIVISADGEIFEFDSLLLAVGSNSFVPPVKGADTRGVLTLKTVDNVQSFVKMRENINEMVVIGGGLLGLEAAAALIHTGIKVTVVEFFDRLLPRQLDYEGAALLKKILGNMGFSFRLGEVTEEITAKNGESSQPIAAILKGLQSGSATGSVRLKSGETLKADAVLFSAGVRPDLTLIADNARASRPDISSIFGPKASKSIEENAEKQRIETDRGIVVNERMQTSLSSIYAAGDVAEHLGMNFCIWPEAMEQGRVAGINMAGGDAVYRNAPPSNMLKVAGIELASAGEIDVEGKLEADITSNDSVYRKIVKDPDGKTVGCIMIGDTADFHKILQQIKGV